MPATSGVTTTSNAPAVNLAPAEAPVAAPASVTAIDSPVTTPVRSGSGNPPALSNADMQKELADAKTQLLAMQKQAGTLNQNNTANTSAVVSSSAPVVQNEKNITDSVNDLTFHKPMEPLTLNMLGAAGVPGASADASAAGTGAGGPDTSAAKTASDQYMATLQSYMASLESRRAGEISSINNDFAQQQESLKNTQDKETGTTTAMLARAGGYLGVSGSGTGVLLSLAQTHASEIANLEQKKQAAITAAQNAISDQEFNVAEKLATQAKAIEQTINDRKQQFFDDTQKVIDQQRNQATFQQTKTQDDLKQLSLLDPAKIPASKKAEIDNYYGTPGFTDKYIATVQATAKADTAAKQLANQKTLLDMLQTIPAGKSVTMPDGTQYTGIGKTGDIVTWMQVDNNGVGHIIALDKGTGKTTVQTVGAVGKSSTTANPQLTNNVMATFLTGGQTPSGKKISGLESTKDANGYYDPETYLTLRQQLEQSNPKLVPTIDAKFLSVGSNGKNSFFTDDGMKYLREHGVYVGKDPIAGVASTDVVPTATDNSISPGQ